VNYFFKDRNVETGKTNILALLNAAPKQLGQGIQPGTQDADRPVFDNFLNNQVHSSQTEPSASTQNNQNFDHTSSSQKETYASEYNTDSKDTGNSDERFTVNENATTRRNRGTEPHHDQSVRIQNTQGQNQKVTDQNVTAHSGQGNKIVDTTPVQTSSSANQPVNAKQNGLVNHPNLLGNSTHEPETHELAGLLNTLTAQGLISNTELEALETATGEGETSALDSLAQLVATLKANPEIALLNADNNSQAQTALLQKLQDLGINPEALNRLLETVQSAGEANAAFQPGLFLQALSNLVQAAQANETAAVQANGQANAQNGNGVTEKLVIDALVQAGLTQDQAKQVLQQASAQGAQQGDDSTDGQLLLAKLTQDVKKLNDAETGKSDSKEVSVDSKGQKPGQSDSPFAQNLKSVSGLAADKADKPVSNLINDTQPSNNQNAQNVTANTKAPVATQNNNANQSQTAPNPAASKVDGATATASSHVNEANGKSANPFKPVMDTYTAKGGAEKPVTTQIIEKASFRSMGNHKEIFVKLDPPSLGTVRMNVSTTGDSVRATIVAETQAAKQAIESNLAHLKDSMGSQGMKVDSFTVLVGGNQENNSAHQRQSGLNPFRPFADAIQGGKEAVEETVAFHRPLFLNDSQTISLFA